MKITTGKSHDGAGSFRALTINDERVSWLNILDYKMRIGGCVVRMGGIAGVATKYPHRMKGYSRRVMEDSLEFMVEAGYDCSLLFGIDGFYEKFGYACVMADVTAKLRTRDAEEALEEAGRFRVRAARPGDYASMARLYNRNNSQRTLSLVRTAAYYSNLRHGSQWRRRAVVSVVEDSRGRFAGYFIHDDAPDPVTVAEVETKDPRAFAAILAFAAGEAVKRRDGEVSFVLSRDHALMDLLRRFGCTVTSEYKSTGRAMGRIVNQDTLLAKIIEARTSGEERLPAFALDVKTELGATRVMIPGRAGSARSRLTIPQATLMQLLVGYRTADEVLLDSNVKATGAAADAVRFLHPGHESYMHAVDHF